MKNKNKLLMWLIATMLALVGFVGVRSAFAGEPLTSGQRESMLDDPQAISCVVDACKAYQGDMDQLEADTSRCWRAHKGRMFFQGFPDGYKRPQKPETLTCENITGKKLPTAFVPLAERAKKRKLDQDELAFLQRKMDEPPAPPAPSATVLAAANPPAAAATEAPGPEAVPAADAKKKATVAKKADKPAAAEPLPIVPVIATSTCTPETFEYRRSDKDSLDLFVKPGADMYQLQHSCWAKKYETQAREVILGNKVQHTIPWCKTTVNKRAKYSFDPRRMDLLKKSGPKVGDEPSADFVAGCDDEHLGYALQAGHVLHLKAKAAPTTTSQGEQKDDGVKTGSLNPSGEGATPAAQPGSDPNVLAATDAGAPQPVASVADAGAPTGAGAPPAATADGAQVIASPDQTAAATTAVPAQGAAIPPPTVGQGNPPGAPAMSQEAPNPPAPAATSPPAPMNLQERMRERLFRNGQQI